MPSPTVPWEVKNRASSFWGIAGAQYGGIASTYDVLPRFKLNCWTTDGPRSGSFALTDTDGALTLDFTARYTSDLTAAFWTSEDLMLHNYLTYNTNYDYSHCIFEFDYTITGDVPDINDPSKGAILTLEDETAEESYFIRLDLYKVSGPGVRTGRYRINFDTVKAGYFADEPVDVTNLTKVLFVATTTRYNSAVFESLGTPETGSITISNVVVTGRNSTLRYSRPVIPAHDIGMCTGYDDQYNFVPSRIIEACIALGYRDYINHYCGMSHYYDQVWVPGEDRWQVTRVGNRLSSAARAWHRSFAHHAKLHDMNIIFSISFELFSTVCPYEWAQRDWYDEFGVTGYTPPSFLLSPCIPDAMDWLKAVFVEFASLADAEGLVPMCQVGEPWWWWNTATRRPCFYDYLTRVKFNDMTGLYAPEFPTIDRIDLVGTPYDEFKDFLKNELGDAVLSMRTAVKAVYPNSLTSTLFFLPSILDPAVGIISDINYPKAQYSFPNLDFIQTEIYDWLIYEDFDKSLLAYTIAIDDLGYPSELLHYLAGFVPDDVLGNIIKPGYDLATDGREIWRSIFGSMLQGKEYAPVGKIYIWSFPQVVRDSLSFTQSAELEAFFLGNSLVMSRLNME